MSTSSKRQGILAPSTGLDIEQHLLFSGLIEMTAQEVRLESAENAFGSFMSPALVVLNVTEDLEAVLLVSNGILDCFNISFASYLVCILDLIQIVMKQLNKHIWWLILLLHICVFCDKIKKMIILKH